MMDNSELKTTLQNHFTDGLAIVVGSGLSAAEGVPGMAALAEHLIDVVPARIDPASGAAWEIIEADLRGGVDLETALLKTQPDEALESVIVDITANFISEAERGVIQDIVTGNRTLRFSRLLSHLIKPNTGIPVITTNYDRLIEVASEAAGLGVDTLFVGQHIGRFNKQESRLSLCRHVTQRKRTVHLSYADHVVILKPHGSVDWFLKDDEPIRCPLVDSSPKLMITPGINKFRGGYERPFDAHREQANKEIDRASRYLIIGYGFNDDHLQVHLEHQMRSGKPVIILTRSLSEKARELAAQLNTVLAICCDEAHDGARIIKGNNEDFLPGPDLWDLGVFIDEVLEP